MKIIRFVNVETNPSLQYSSFLSIWVPLLGWALGEPTLTLVVHTTRIVGWDILQSLEANQAKW